MKIYICLTNNGYHIDYFGWTASKREAKKWMKDEENGNLVRITFRADSKPEEHFSRKWGEWEEVERE